MMAVDGKTGGRLAASDCPVSPVRLSRALGVHVIDQTGITDQFISVSSFLRGQDALDAEAAISAALERAARA